MSTIKEGDTISFRIDSRLDRPRLQGKVELKEQLGLIVMVEGKQYELKKLVDIKLTKKSRDERLRIPPGSEIRRHFPKQVFYEDYMQKLVWEEDD